VDRDAGTLIDRMVDLVVGGGHNGLVTAPTLAMSGHDTPIVGLFVTGADTAPVGGIAGSPGRAAAEGILTWRRRSGR
jgi:phytoene dehydrogenase-like protein